MNNQYVQRQNRIHQLQMLLNELQRQHNQRPVEQRTNIRDHRQDNSQDHRQDYSHSNNNNGGGSFSVHNGANSTGYHGAGAGAGGGNGQLTLEQINHELARLQNMQQGGGNGGRAPPRGNGPNVGVPAAAAAAAAAVAAVARAEQGPQAAQVGEEQGMDGNMADAQRESPALSPAPQESVNVEDDMDEEMGGIDSAQSTFDDTPMLSGGINEGDVDMGDDEKDLECNGINENNKINLDLNEFGQGNGLATNVVARCYECAKGICKLPIDIQNHAKQQFMNEVNQHLVSIKLDNGSLNVLNEIPTIIGSFNAARAVTGDAQLSTCAEDIFKSSVWGPELELFLKSMKEQ